MDIVLLRQLRSGENGVRVVQCCFLRYWHLCKRRVWRKRIGFYWLIFFFVFLAVFLSFYPTSREKWAYFGCPLLTLLSSHCSFFPFISNKKNCPTSLTMNIQLMLIQLMLILLEKNNVTILHCGLPVACRSLVWHIYWLTSNSFPIPIAFYCISFFPCLPRDFMQQFYLTYTKMPLFSQN